MNADHDDTKGAKDAVEATRRATSRVTRYAPLIACTLLAVSLPGCSSTRPNVMLPDTAAVRRHADQVVRQSMEAAAAMRAELAAARIAAAKQEVEQRELRRQVEELQHLADTRQQEVVALRSERDELEKTSSELRVQSAALLSQAAELPKLRQEATETTGTQGKLKEIEALVAGLTEDLARVKRDLAREPVIAAADVKQGAATRSSPGAGAGQTLAMATRAPKGAPNDPNDLSRHDAADDTVHHAMIASVVAPVSLRSIVVQKGETLGRLARRHGVTVRALMDANGLRGDRILIGQRLLVPAGQASVGQSLEQNR